MAGIPMIEIYKVIANVPLLYQLLDDKNGSVNGANINQVYICAVI